jgi:CBS domain-containing protein
MQLTDVMSTQIVSIRPETAIGDAARRMIEAETGAAMVLAEGDTLVGVITERDLLRCISDGIDRDTAVSERMTRHVLTASPTTELAEAMALMVDGHFRHLPVVNEGGDVVGVVSMRDLMAYTSLRLRQGATGPDDDLDPAEVLATIHRMRTGAA